VALLWLLPPSSAKNRLLNACGYRIDPTAVVRPNLVWRVREFEIGPGARLGLLNFIKNLKRVELAAGSSVGRFNVISAHPIFSRLYPSGGRFVVGEHGGITSGHRLDCSGSIEIGALSLVAGRGTNLLSHSIDLERDAQAAYPITIGERCFLGTGCLLVGGAVLPARSVLAARSVLTPGASPEQGGLWAGAPASYKGPRGGKWFERGKAATRDVYLPAEDRVVKDAF